MNGITNYGPVAVTVNTRMPAVSRGFLALQGTGLSGIDGIGALPRIRFATEPIVIDQQDIRVMSWRSGAAPAVTGALGVASAAAAAAADKRAASLRKGRTATVNRRPRSRPR